jgi:hypothetical protein
LTIKNVQQAFEKFEADSVRVPGWENDAAKSVHSEIRETVEKELEQVLKTFLSGSYSRRVQVVRLKDVDAIVLDDPEETFANSAEAALEAIREATKCSDLVRRTHLGVRAVKLFLHDHEFTVDLVAARQPTSGDGLLLARHLPDEGYDDWQLLNPEGQKQAAVAKNEECDEMYVPAVRIIKFWNKGQGDPPPLRSYHAEAIAWHALNGPVAYDEAMVRFFDEAYERLAPGAYTPDPGAPDTDPWISGLSPKSVSQPAPRWTKHPRLHTRPSRRRISARPSIIGRKSSGQHSPRRALRRTGSLQPWSRARRGPCTLVSRPSEVGR